MMAAAPTPGDGATAAPLNVEALRHRFEEAFLALWNNDAEDDGLNRLLVGADLTWRQISVLRAYAKYLRQAGSTFSGSYVERSVVANPGIAKLLVQLFERRFDPAGRDRVSLSGCWYQVRMARQGDRQRRSCRQTRFVAPDLVRSSLDGD